jgi:NADPH:quinone reductase-like Zn-dependent oxidoreductase
VADSSAASTSKALFTAVNYADTVKLFVRQTLAALTNSENAADLTTLADLAEAGRLAPAIDRRYPLEDSVAAIRRRLGGHASGKLVIRVVPDGEGIPAAGKPQ